MHGVAAEAEVLERVIVWPGLDDDGAAVFPSAQMTQAMLAQALLDGRRVVTFNR
jgi:hypothetical protein